ncbi:hypothetical protein [Chitinibacter sp. S2-10]|uniref:hypothetical protein n=1 Tax=Chitinibacter sp. S2-10 TaxID=3373597 RepID=UPI0039773285
MDIEKFSEITKKIIADNGFDEFAPVACFPSRNEIRVLSGIPTNADIEKEVLSWAKSLLGECTEFLTAFKISNTQFKVIQYKSGEHTSCIYQVEARKSWLNCIFRIFFRIFF